MNKISLFGAGFVGGEFVKQFPEETVVVERNAKYAPTNDILYMRSTIHNYHPKDGDLFIDIDTNLIHFMQTIEANSHKENMVFNLVSSWFVYGKGGKLPASEDDPCNPSGFYSVTAFAREKLLQSYCETFGKKYRILRLGNVIGIGDKKASPRKNALQWMVKELAQGRDVSVYKGGAIRDYIDVRDCARAIHLVLEKGELNQVYNISNGQGLNIADLVETAHRASGFKARVREMDVPDFHKVVQTPKMYLDTKKLNALGYVKQHDIKTTVEELVHYYERNEN
jgi:nucleoside-diphosphate-sugar epimerase